MHCIVIFESRSCIYVSDTTNCLTQRTKHDLMWRTSS